MDRLFTPLDVYCERLDPGFWAEPANALTNLLIVAAGLFGVSRVRGYQTGAFAETLAWWVVVIGVGSFLFHTTAVELTKWADILPIAAFTLAMALFALRRFARLSWPASLAYFVIYLVAISVVTWFVPAWLHEATNGTTGYLPAFGGFVFCGVVALARGSPGGWYALACAGILLVGFVFRAIDRDVCGVFPVGTHFLWHISIALMLVVSLEAVAKHGAPRGQPSGRC